MNNTDDFISIEDFIDSSIGPKGSTERDEFEYGCFLANIGFAIKKIRKEKKITQKELAAKIGVSRSAIAQWERAESNLELKTLHKIGSALNIKFRITWIDDDE